MGPLAIWANWQVEHDTQLWQDFQEFMLDLLVKALAVLLDFGAVVIESIPVPDLVTNYTIGGMLGNVGGDLLWIVGAFRLGEGLGLVGAGYAFRLLRKALTLGQW